MTFEEFKEFCKEAWEENFGYPHILQLDDEENNCSFNGSKKY